ncbi:NAD-dependent epimerase/dehydratase family protein [Mycolicibacterium sp. 018/SC-01/001]|uniref:NAD-dependent epimerase/dehydratase family protein n=1 Tax=Mycolicibacterium sp. 018/SC-01/001 TaxID=2592069 RepID=UPI00117E826A|nr:NAD-dependent epimerase/dehydratase family protein [Mycolicibacterium sp. 018/SC-01/001]TRW87974.1 NAD-dependent epimerase/dehydratase family protein [Mycolicibacterium sp. 018/SC-01/001]
MRVVVTGASGNVGTALLRRLTDDAPEWDIVGVVRRPPEPEGVYERVEWRELDLVEPDAAQRLTQIVKGADAIVHLAWGFQPTRDTEYLTRLGVGGTLAVLQAAHQMSIPHLIHMSSVGTYAAGRYTRKVDESWVTSGIPSSPYSRDKSAAEELLNDHEREHGTDAVPIARMRPGFVVQRDAASGLMRYALPGWVPMLAVPMLPVLPLDRRLCIPIIHADDVASAILRALERRATGAFNLAAEPAITRAEVAQVLGSFQIHVPSRVLSTLTDLSWRAGLQPVDRGWLDLLFSVPLLDCSRAHSELGWEPQWSSVAALADVVTGVALQAHSDSPPLRSRSVFEQIRRDLTEGALTMRRLP